MMRGTNKLASLFGGVSDQVLTDNHLLNHLLLGRLSPGLRFQSSLFSVSLLWFGS